MEEAPPSSTVGSNPWRPPLRQLSNDLLPVTAASRVVSTPMGMAKLACPLQVVGCWLVDGRTPEHIRRLILPDQCVPPNIVRHS